MAPFEHGFDSRGVPISPEGLDNYALLGLIEQHPNQPKPMTKPCLIRLQTFGGRLRATNASPSA
jgi:hypothetical protein